MGRKLLHLLNGIITCAVVAALVIAGAYAGYALWDNQQIYDAAENVYSEMKEIRGALGMPTTVSALTELLEESRAARRAKAAETAAPTPDITETPVPAEPTPETATAALMASAETKAPEAATVNNGETAVSVSTEKEAPVQESASLEANEVAVGDTTVTVTGEAAWTTETSVTAETATAASATTEPATAEPATAAPATAEPATAVPATATPAPTEEPADDSLFGQLKAINKDITAWITLPGTAIDYPVMQGRSNYSYINTDVYGHFALAGSIFLDYRNSEDYTDIYSLLYGHNMSQHRMFSDINLYKDEEFFNENTLGIMLMPDGNHLLEVLSVIVTPASDSGLMNPENWSKMDGEEIYLKVQENTMFTCEKGLEDLRRQIDAGETPRVISLSTCSEEFTDARTILLTLMDP